LCEPILRAWPIAAAQALEPFMSAFSGCGERHGVAGALRLARRMAVALLGTLWLCSAHAGGGPLGIDHRLSYDNSGIWKRSNQTALEGIVAATVIGGSLWEGGDTRLGKTFWQSLDSSLLGVGTATVAKDVFTRSRPSQGNDPNQWFKGSGHYSFPSGEVTFQSAAITPFVLEYRHDYPAVWGLEVLPLYDAIGRLKQQAHWQTDVLAGWALGFGTGYLAHERNSPFVLGLLPHGFEVGFKERW
jgi:membrane-associated phospholipid phosphatase